MLLALVTVKKTRPSTRKHLQKPSYNSLTITSGIQMASEDSEISLMSSNSSGSQTRNSSVQIWEEQRVLVLSSHFIHLNILLQWKMFVCIMRRKKAGYLPVPDTCGDALSLSILRQTKLLSTQFINTFSYYSLLLLNAWKGTLNKMIIKNIRSSTKMAESIHSWPTTSRTDWSMRSM